MARATIRADQSLTAEPLSNANPLRELCQHCGLFQTCKSPFMRPFVPKGWFTSKRKTLVVGEAGGDHEDTRSGKQFTGKSGQLLRKILAQCGYVTSDVAFDNAVKCRPVDNATPTMSQLRACRPFLLQTIRRLQPQSIIGLGATALKTLVNDGSNGNVTKARGKLLEVPGLWGTDPPPPVGVPRVWITYHPASILYGATYLEELIREDLCRTWGSPPTPVVGLPVGEVLGVDTEYMANGELLTVAFSDGVRAWAFDREDMEEQRWRTGIQSLLDQAKSIVGHALPNDVASLLQGNFGLKPSWL